MEFPLGRSPRQAAGGAFGAFGALAAAVAVAAAPALALAASAKPPELPIEQLSVAKLAPADPYRIYLSDPTMHHLVDGRIHIVDGTSMRYLGMLGAGFSASSTLSRDRQSLFVATTYHSRLQRGARTDVVEVYGTDDLALRYEIEIPAKHVEALPIRALMATSQDGRFLFVQNATPATSISVVDIATRKFAAEIPTPGCYGAIAWPDRPRRFSSVCGDGTLATFDLDEQGALAASSVSAPFFDPDKDPVFMHYELLGHRLSFVSYHGQVHEIDLGGDQPVAAPPWPLVDAVSAKKAWRPGGYELFAIEPRSGRLYVGMHDQGAEGTHKNPAKEIWVFDTKTRHRVARMPGHAAISLAIAHADKPRLYLLSGGENRLVSFDIAAKAAPSRPLARSEPFGETPIYLEMQ